MATGLRHYDVCRGHGAKQASSQWQTARWLDDNYGHLNYKTQSTSCYNNQTTIFDWSYQGGNLSISLLLTGSRNNMMTSYERRGVWNQRQQSGLLKSLFGQAAKETKLNITCHLWGESNSDWLIPLTKGQYMTKAFLCHYITFRCGQSTAGWDPQRQSTTAAGFHSFIGFRGRQPIDNHYKTPEKGR